MTVPDRPVHAALQAGQAGIAERRGLAARFPADVAPFTGIPGADGGAEGRAWADAAQLAGPGGQVVLLDGAPGPVPAGWSIRQTLPCLQMVAPGAVGAPDEEALRLGPADVDDMLALVAGSRPGPFERRTVELGTYLGIRRDGRLVAMAGERVRPPGHTEISAVCTAVEGRGQGLARRLVLAVMAGIVARGETPYLHVLDSNVGAIRLYEQLGFTTRHSVDVLVLTAP